MTLEKAFGAALKEQRLKSTLTQVELAELSGFDVTYISLLERGLRQPSLKAFIKLSEGLGVSPEAVLKATLRKYRS